VHEDHGVGRFIRFDTKEVGGVVRDYLYLEFRGDDRLYVPHDQLAKVSRYVGADGRAPSLAKLGGKAWSTLKSRARVAVRERAGELLALYARRQTATRPAVGPDDEWMARLEASFPFDETDDQGVAIDAVKQDLEAPQPMDRLVCGDVGFGKTEVAVRAAFKVAAAGRQVLMLVPTTILAQQHAATLRERFRDFPVRVEMVSRFRAPAEVKKVLAEFAAGKVDVLVGTHRVLSRDVVPQNLGLVVLDEEQRFGVAQTELLRQLRLEVDVLAMSATPIPRTLHMSLSGLRDISVITTPPRGRHPIKTHVGEFDEELIAAGLRREHARGGQSFYLHNRVETIEDVAERVRRWVPELRVGVAHGQMAERALEGVMMQFLRGEFDVLVSTTIIETGLDIANANTIIIDRADKYGLSQLHQLRGRVGRGRERAYAYFLYDENTPLSETAHDRLATIAANNELGSGMQVALKDLEIRGAGNLLGGEQAGHIAGVGFDLYLRMIGEAVSTFRGDVAEGQTELRLELPVDAHIPEDYVDSERLRLEAYQKLSTASSLAAKDENIAHVLEELTDRYGEPPAAVQTLIAVSTLRRQAQRASLSEVVAMGDKLRVSQATLPDSIQVRLQRMYPGSRYFAQQGVLSVPLPDLSDAANPDAALIGWVSQLLTAIFPPPVVVQEKAADAG
jgi:transcription-repair coupling factor (superfamily II helicase)